MATSARRNLAASIDAGVAASMVWRFGWSPVLPAYLALAALSGIVIVTDFTEHRIPTRVVLPAYPIGAALLALACLADGSWWPLARAVCAAAVVGGDYLLVALVLPGQLGLGDVRLGGLLGGYLGFLGWSSAVMGVLLGWCLGACFVLVRHGVPHPGGVRISLGPFLLAGGIIAVLISR